MHFAGVKLVHSEKNERMFDDIGSHESGWFVVVRCTELSVPSFLHNRETCRYVLKSNQSYAIHYFGVAKLARYQSSCTKTLQKHPIHTKPGAAYCDESPILANKRLLTN